MKRMKGLSAAIAIGALSLTMATPAFAGKANDARKAIAAAQAKVETAHTLGAGHQLPTESAQADEALTLAQADFKAGRKDEAIEKATHAEALATAAIGRMQQDKDAALSDARAQRDVAMTVAQNQQDQAAAAQQQAADANVRANQAAQSAADARAAALAAATPAKVETTVTTQQPAAAAPRKTATKRVVRRKVTHSAPAASGKVTTTTTVSTGN